MSWIPPEQKKERKRKWDVGAESGPALSQQSEIGATSSPPGLIGGLNTLSNSLSATSPSLFPSYSSPSSLSLSSPSLSSSSSSVLPMPFLLGMPSPQSTSSSSSSSSSSLPRPSLLPEPENKETALMRRYPGAVQRAPIAKKSGWPKKTGSTYAVFSDPMGNFLTGVKNNHAKWGEWGDKPLPITNNPGQHVFPGGGLEDKPFTNDNIIFNALKEFEEETGFRPDLKTGKVMLHHRTGSPVEVASFKGRPQVINPEPNGQFKYAGVHIPVDTLESMIKTFSEIRNVDEIYNENLEHSKKYRKDDEISVLKSLSKDKARNYFTTESGKEGVPAFYADKKPYTTTKGKPVMTKTSTLWLDKILQNIKLPSDASSSSSSSSSS